MNNLKIVFLTSLLVIIHLVFLPFYKKYSAKLDQGNWKAKTLDKIYKLFTFSIYIRIFLEIYLYLLISSIDEIYRFNIDSLDLRLSFIINQIILAVCLAMIYTSFHLIFITKMDSDAVSKGRFREIYNNTKPSRIHLLYNFVFCLNKLLLVSIVIILQDVNATTINILC